MTIKDIILLIGALISLVLVSRNILNIIFGLRNYNIHKKRLKQLEFKKNKELDIKDAIETTTKPFIGWVSPKLGSGLIKNIETNLKLIKWDKYFTPEQFIVLYGIIKIVGIFAFLILKNIHIFIALVWAIPLLILFDVLFFNAVNNKKEQLINDFPKLIRSVSSLLNSGLTVEEAFTDALKAESSIWDEYVKNFLLDIQNDGINSALETFKETVPLNQAKNFISLIQLSLETTSNIQDSFEGQIEKIYEMQDLVFEKKLTKREGWTYAVQLPLLLAMMVAFGLPTIYSAINLSSI